MKRLEETSPQAQSHADEHGGVGVPESLSNILQDAGLEVRSSKIQGLGLFATRDIPCASRFLEYVGERITKAESLKRCMKGNQSIMYLDDMHNLDGDVEWNPARYINHSCGPNCEAVSVEGKIWIIAQRLIKAGEEITFDYGYDLDQYEEHPCYCGAESCAGYIIAAPLRAYVRKSSPG